MSEAANSATPTNSLTRRDTLEADPLTGQISMMTGSTNGRRPERLRKNRRSSTRSFPDQARVGAFLEARLFHDLAQDPRPLGQEFLAVLHDDAARDDIRDALEHARLLVDRDDGNDQAVLGEMPAVAEHLAADFAGAGAVDEHAARRSLARDLRAVAGQLEDVAVFDEQRLRMRVAPGNTFRDARVLRQLAVLAVDRDEVARPHERQHQLELFFAQCPETCVLDALVNDVGAAAAGDHARWPSRCRNRARR